MNKKTDKILSKESEPNSNQIRIKNYKTRDFNIISKKGRKK
jgi:hypothetical protein